ncbi:NAD-dependent epimerase/dehydratase family protein [Heliobacterium gestii]|uniref:GDP-L-fucose synthase n=1 Tax=Heliomicrobium gestii TaxID=2699 RepID=A0A845L8G5_HELGE|nr:GDP-L-fucose synthase [Heliomicrobium gestii]MBM7866683.1 GDP-L-fucose synthase [Heliomicrobium gestii]MZP43037.1 NAD-dependent epimerase/dehydratase family protein [Heliomicrobium gestii]
MTGFFANRRVLVTGGAGFLGSYVVDGLHTRGCQAIFVPRSKDYDLTQLEDIKRLYEECKPDIVIHLAAVVGGIEANRKNPGKFFYDNLIMGVQLMEWGRVYGVEKFVAVGTVCAYPKFCPPPFHEDDLWNGYPEETNAPYGLAKKMMLVQSQAYRQQYGFNSIFLLPVNLYGPRDNFDYETSHVIPALIRKFIEAKAAGTQEVVFWGDGTPTREFLFVEDAAEGILLATEHYNESLPVNLGTGSEIAIRELAELIAGIVDYRGDILWDTSRPNGQPRRMLDTSRAKEKFGYQARVSLEEGLRETIRWYLENRQNR